MAPSASISMVTTVESLKGLGKPARNHTFDEALELAGFGRLQVLLVVLSGLGMMASINESMGMSIILPAAQCDLDLDPGEKGIIGGAVFLGIMVSSYFWGYLADTRGRQVVLKYALFTTSLCAVISSFATGFVSLFVLRILTGICVSAPGSTVYAYLGEFCTSRKRVQMLSFASVWGGVGILYVAVIGWWILSYDWVLLVGDFMEYKPWRLLFIVYTIPGFLNAIAFCYCPESPKFLLSQGREREALEVLRLVYRINHGVPTADDFEVTALRLDEADDIPKREGGLLRSMWEQTVPLLKLPYVIYFVVCCIQQMGAFAIYGGLGLWFPGIMNQIYSQTDSGELKVCTVLQNDNANANTTAEMSAVCTDDVQMETFLYTTILGLTAAGYALLTSFILGKVNQKVMLVFNCLVAGTAGIALQFITNSYAVAVLFCIEIVLAGFCILLINATAVTIFPTSFKAMAVSLSNMLGRFSCFVASAVIGVLMMQNCPLTFYFLTGLLYVCAALTLLLPKSAS